jgi:hypothetical protein
VSARQLIEMSLAHYLTGADTDDTWYLRMSPSRPTAHHLRGQP